jgi:hypothetical protein
MDVPGLRVVFEDEGLQIATWSRVFINRWRTVATLERLLILGEHQHALIASTGDRRIAVLTTLEDRSGLMPNGPARKEAEAIARSTRDAVILQAQVLVGDGFVAASIRALLTGVMLAIRAPFPNRVFKTVDEALPWIEDTLRKAGHPQDAEGVATAVRGLTARSGTAFGTKGEPTAPRGHGVGAKQPRPKL